MQDEGDDSTRVPISYAPGTILTTEQVAAWLQVSQRHVELMNLPRLKGLARVARYEAGATIRELAVWSGAHRETVVRHPVRGGVELRRSGLTEDQIKEAARRYLDGATLVEIAERYGVVASTVRAALLRQGLRLRPAARRRIAAVRALRRQDGLRLARLPGAGTPRLLRERSGRRAHLPFADSRVLPGLGAHPQLERAVVPRHGWPRRPEAHRRRGETLR